MARRHTDQGDTKAVRAGAIYQLFIVAGNTLLRGLLEPEDVQVCFETLNAQISFGGIAGLNARKLQIRCATHSNASRRNLTRLVRNFARSILRGQSRRGGKSKEVPRRLKNARGKRRKTPWPSKFLRRSKLPLHSFLRASRRRGRHRHPPSNLGRRLAYRNLLPHTQHLHRI